mgnify:CR=1 FL=1
MSTTTTTGTLTAGSSKTFNLAPGSALSLTLSPNVRVTITETPETVSGSGVGGNTTRVHEPQLAGTFAYGPYAMGGVVVVAVASNSGSSVAWTRKDTVVSTSSDGLSLVSGDGNKVGSSLIYQSAVPITAPLNTSNNVLLAVTLPPLQANSRIQARMLWTFTNNANTKNTKVRLGGSAEFYNAGLSSLTGANTVIDIINRGATNSQIGTPINVGQTLGSLTQAWVTSAIDTSTSQLLTFECQKTVAGDSMILQAAWVEVFW